MTRTEAFGIRTKSGVAIIVPRSLKVITTYILLEQETWFEEELDFAGKCIQPGDAVVDVGANFGLYSTILARATGPTGTVFAFEPAANTARFLRATVSALPETRVQVEQAALSDRAGHARLEIGASPELCALTAADNPTQPTEQVPLVALDSYLGEHARAPISFLKLDAEGHELPIIVGGHRTLSRDRPLVQFEISQAGSHDFGPLSALEKLGYAFFRLVPGVGALVPYDRREQTDSFQLNLFACHPQRAEILQQRDLLVVDHHSTIELPAGQTNLDGRQVICHLGKEPGSSDPYHDCLKEYMRFRRATRATDRYRHLRAARQLSIAALQESASDARAITSARIERDLGSRNAAVDILKAIGKKIADNKEWSVDEPCLWPSFHGGGADQPPQEERLRNSVHEAYERWHIHSSCYAKSHLPFLDFICASPCCSPEMHRRRQLTRIREGIQSRPEPHPALVVPSAENLNPWFWRGEF